MRAFVRKLVLIGLTSLAGASGVLALADSTAFGFLGYASRTSVFGEGGSGAGQFSLNPTTSAPGAGVAVDDSTHDFYVADTFNHRVQKFSAEGAFIAAWGWGVSNGENEFELCTSSCLAGLPGAGEGQFNTPVSVAVDNSGGSSAGDVYVADRGNLRVERFSSVGVPLGHFGAVGDPGSALDPSGGLADMKGGNSVFVDPTSGNVWVADASNKRAVQYSPSGEYTAQITDSAISENAFGLTVDTSGDVYVIDGASSVKEFGPGPSFAFIRNIDGPVVGVNPRAIVTNPANEAFVGNAEESGLYQIYQFGLGENVTFPTATFGREAIGGSTGIAMDSTSGRIYVADGANNDVDVFDRVTLADVTTGGSSNVKGTTAAVEGTVNPQGLETHYYFEYGENQTYGSTSAEETSSESAGIATTANLTGLLPLTAYHYRLVAVNENGTSRGQDKMFRTGPAIAGVLTNPASNVGITTATLNGQLNPEGNETTYVFQYGPSAEEYTASSEIQVSSAGAEIMVSATISELEAGTTYHYRILAFNEHGQTPGEDRTFTTLPAVATVNDQIPFATGISLHEATLHGTVNPGHGVTGYHFVYGPTAAYGSRAPAPDAYTQLNYEDDSVEQLLTGLQPGTEYHYALIATNLSGTTTGPDETFTTLSGAPPAVETGGASLISPSAATITGTVDPAGLSGATYEFEVGTSTSYGTQLFGTTSSKEKVTAALAGLLPETVYHYRLVASSAGGTTFGADQTFLTPPVPIAIFQPKTPALLPIPVFPVEQPPQVVRCKKGFVKKAGKCVKKRHPRHKKHRKK